MHELGHWLRETREEQGLSLAEVEAQTRIRQKFIAALEAEEWQALPGNVTTRGFLRKYATYLGLDSDEALRRYQKVQAAPSAPTPSENALSVERELDYRPIEVELSKKEAPNIPWRLIASVVLVVLLGTAAWYIWIYRPPWLSNLGALLPERLPLVSDSSTTPSPEPTATMIIRRVTATPSDTPETTPTAEPTATAIAEADSELPTEPAEATATTSAISNLQLRVDITQRAYLKVIVDGEDRLETILEAGETREWQGTQRITLRTGNAAGIQVTINGQPHRSLGGPGEVVELSWELDNGRLVEATPLSSPSATATTASSTPSSTPEAAAQPVKQGSTAIAAVATPDLTEVTPTTSGQPANALELQLEVTVRSWVRVVVDDAIALEGTLQPGINRNWTATRSVHLRTGNASGLAVTVNGQRRAPLGATGQVIDLVWRLETGRIVEATPTATALPPSAS